MKKNIDFCAKKIVKVTFFLSLVLFKNFVANCQDFESIFKNGFEENHTLIKKNYQFQSFSSNNGSVIVEYYNATFLNEHCFNVQFTENYNVEYLYGDVVNSIDIRTRNKQIFNSISDYCKTKCKKISEEKDSESVSIKYSNNTYLIEIRTVNATWFCDVSNKDFHFELYLIQIKRVY